VTMTFADTGDGRTLVKIHEAGWSDTPAGEKAAFGNCEGWTGMLCAMKVFVEHGLNLRRGLLQVSVLSPRNSLGAGAPYASLLDPC
jgi:hypothetical protein